LVLLRALIATGAEWNLCRSILGFIHATFEGAGYVDVAADYQTAIALAGQVATALRQVIRSSSAGPLSELKEEQDGMEVDAGDDAQPAMFPVVTSEEDLRIGSSHPVREALQVLGAYVAVDTKLFASLIRISKRFDAVSKADFLENCVLPGMSIVEPSTQLLSDVWEHLESLPYEERHRFYAVLKHELPNQYPVIHFTNAVAASKLRKVMRRISKDSGRTMYRAVGKRLLVNPLACFDAMMDQVKSYENIIEPLVESLRYCSEMGLDMLIYVLLEQMSNTERDKLKKDGTNVADWFTGLSMFAALLLRNYSNVDMKGILNFIFNRLQNEDALVIILLRDIVTKIAGIESAEEESQKMIEASSASALLKDVTGALPTADNNAEDLTKESLKALRQALRDTGLVVLLAVCVANLRRSIVHYSEYRQLPLKIVSYLRDMCQEILIQYGGFLEDDTDEDKHVFDVGRVLELHEFKVTTDACFLLSRRQTKFLDLFDNQTPRESIVDSVKELQSDIVWSSFSPELFVSFWSLTLYDIYVPEEAFETEMKRLRTADPAQDDKEKESQLADELEAHKVHQSKVIETLKARKSNFFLTGPDSSIVQTAFRFMERCLMARCISTQEDSLFCAKFFSLMLEIGPANFSIISCFFCLFRVVNLFIFSCTELESGRLGRFISETLRVLESLRSSEEKYSLGLRTNPQVFSSKSQAASTMPHRKFVTYISKQLDKSTKAFVKSLASEEYVEVRNSLIVLSQVVTVFPKTKEGAEEIRVQVEVLKDCDRKDLKLMAASYLSLLSNSSSNRITQEEYIATKPELPPPPVDTKQRLASPKVSGFGMKPEVTSNVKKSPSSPAQQASAAEPAVIDGKGDAGVVENGTSPTSPRQKRKATQETDSGRNSPRSKRRRQDPPGRDGRSNNEPRASNVVKPVEKRSGEPVRDAAQVKAVERRPGEPARDGRGGDPRPVSTFPGARGGVADARGGVADARTVPSRLEGRVELRVAGRGAESRADARGDGGRSDAGRNDPGRNDPGRSDAGRSDARGDGGRSDGRGDARADTRLGDVRGGGRTTFNRRDDRTPVSERVGDRRNAPASRDSSRQPPPAPRESSRPPPPPRHRGPFRG